MNVRNVISRYLDSSAWQSLRTTCRDFKQRHFLQVDCDFVYFAIDNRSDIMRQGVVYALSDVREVLYTLHRTKSNELWTTRDEIVLLHVRFIKFDPLIIFEGCQSYVVNRVASMHELGRHYFGVKYAVPLSISQRTHGFKCWKPVDPNDDPILEGEMVTQFRDLFLRY